MQPQEPLPAVSILRTSLVVMAMVFLCIFITFWAIDFACYNDINEWLPYYPGAVEADLTASFRPRASGLTIVVLQTDDNPNQVRAWYFDQARQRNREGITNTLATVDFEVQPLPQGGSQIILTSQCGVVF